jgi:hypothetical protein
MCGRGWPMRPEWTGLERRTPNQPSEGIALRCAPGEPSTAPFAPQMKTKILALIILYVCFPTQIRAIQADDPFALAETANLEKLNSDERLQFPILKEERKGSGVRIAIEKTSRGEVTLMLINDSNETVYVPGHGLKSPFYEIQIFSNDRWSFDPNHMNCGTGAYLSRLAAGQWFRFKVTFPKGSRQIQVKFQYEGSRDQAGNRKTTDLCTGPIHLKGEQAAPSDGEKPPN